MKPSQLKGEKKMTWKKDGTVKCGPFTARILETQVTFSTIYRWRISGFTETRYASSRANAKRAAETWLRKQATQMLKDLGAPNE